MQKTLLLVTEVKVSRVKTGIALHLHVNAHTIVYRMVYEIAVRLG